MAIFNRFPFTNAHELNLDWILRQLKDLLRRVKILEQSGGGGGGGGTSDYNDLSNKPSINGVQLVGNKTMTQLKLDEIYWVKYGTTTYTEIGNELNNGKLPICEYAGRYYIYSQTIGTTRFFVSLYVSNSQMVWVTVNSSNVWTYNTSPRIPEAGTNNPVMDGTAAVGTSIKYARQDHVHPSDTSKIDMPAGGSVGQVLKKTVHGVEWANESGGGGGTTKTLISHVLITGSTPSVGISGVSYENILIITSGLKTAKTASMGAYINITGSIGTTPTGSILYDSNVFASITNQCGYCLIEDLAAGMKFIKHTKKPSAGAETSTDAIGLINGSITVPLLLGTINEITITPSDSNYPFTAGEVAFYGW